MKNIVLIGLPGSGKTSIGKYLRRLTGRPFWDSDKEIQKRTVKTISEIFALGEDVFRTEETLTLKKLANEDGCIIATGGGAVLNNENIEALKVNGIIIYLDRSVENILKDTNLSKRPLLAQNKEKLYQLFNEREKLYTQYADKIFTDKHGWYRMQQSVASFVKEFWK